MTKKEMRHEFFAAKEELRQALISFGLNEINQEEFQKAVHDVWHNMNETAKRFK